MARVENDSGQLGEFRLLDGDVRAWIEQESSIHLKAADGKFNDPVELTPEMARQLATALTEFASRVD
jgi:hypothetical protein